MLHKQQQQNNGRT